MAQVKNEYGINIGDIFSSLWGWEQTNVTFYQVTKVTAKTITVREIQRTVREGECWGNYEALPVPDSFCGKEIRRKVWGNKPAIFVNSYMAAFLWDGKPEHGTSYA